MRNLIAFLLLLPLALFAAELGSKENPLTIESVGDLVKFRNAVNDSGLYKGVKLANGAEGLFFKLEADLDLKELCGASIGNWEPIGPFEGNFDGANHKISNFYYDDALTPLSRDASFFRTVFNNTKDTLVFENVEFENAYIHLSKSSSGFGFFISQVITGNVLVRNVKIELHAIMEAETSANTGYSAGAIMVNTLGSWTGFYNNEITGTFEFSNGGLYAGGIVGTAVGPTSFEDNTVNVNFILKKSKNPNVGGLAGTILSDYTMTGNKNYGSIKMDACEGYSFIGGLVGANPSLVSKKIVSDNTNYGDITYSSAQGAVGGLYGYISGNSNTTFEKCTNEGGITVNKLSDKDLVQVGGIAGILEVSAVTDLVNNGNITVSGITGEQDVGGIAGYVRPGVSSVTLINSTNNGNILVDGGSGNVNVAGLIGTTAEISYVRLVESENAGEISVEKHEGPIVQQKLAAVPNGTMLLGKDDEILENSSQPQVSSSSTNNSSSSSSSDLQSSSSKTIQSSSSTTGIVANVSRVKFTRSGKSLFVELSSNSKNVEVQVVDVIGHKISVDVKRYGNILELQGIPQNGMFIVRIKSGSLDKLFVLRN